MVMRLYFAHVHHKASCRANNLFAHFLSCSQLFGVSEEAFLRATEDVMLTLIDNIETFIYWPPKNEYPNISHQFDQMGR